MNLRLLQDATVEPLTQADAESYAWVDVTDPVTPGLIMAARLMAESLNGREMAIKQYELALDAFPGSLAWGMTSIASPYFGFWPSDAYFLYMGQRPPRHAIGLLAPLT